MRFVLSNFTSPFTLAMVTHILKQTPQPTVGSHNDRLKEVQWIWWNGSTFFSIPYLIDVGRSAKINKLWILGIVTCQEKKRMWHPHREQKQSPASIWHLAAHSSGFDDAGGKSATQTSIMRTARDWRVDSAWLTDALSPQRWKDKVQVPCLRGRLPLWSTVWYTSLQRYNYFLSSTVVFKCSGC